MSATITNRTDTEVTLAVTLTAADMAPHVAHVYEHLRGRVKADGFRPGKAPDHIVERQLGASMVQSEVIDDVLQNSYAAAVREFQLPVIASPNVEITKFVPYTELEYTAKAEIMPPVTLPDYKNIKAKKGSADIKPGDIDQVITDLGKRVAERATVERPAATGDEVDFDFAGSLKGEPVPGATAKNYKLTLGSGNFIPGFEEELTGLKAGDDKTFTIKFPKDYHEATLAGQNVEFQINVHSVTAITAPEFNDEFAAKVSEFKTLAELRADVEVAIGHERSEQLEKQFENDVLEELLAKTKYSVPQRLLEQQIERLKSELLQNLGTSGLDLERYAEATGKTVAQIEDELKPTAEKRVGLAMLLTEIAKAESITVSPEDIDDELNRLRQNYSDAELRAELDKPETREDVYNHLMSLRTIERVISYSEKA